MEVVNQTRANDTLPPDMIFGQAQIISISAYTPLFIISAVLNLRVLRKLWQTKHRNGLSRLNQLLMHLVLADLSVTFFMMPLEIIWAITVSWWAGDILCRVCSFFRIFGLFLSSNIVVCISIDRFLAILKPFSVRGSSRRIKVMLATAWGLAVLLSLPQMYVFHVESHPDFPWYEQCVTFGSFSSRLYEFLYFFMGMIFLYICPLVVIIVTYGGIIIHLHRKSGSITTCIKRTTAQDEQNWDQPEMIDDEDELATTTVKNSFKKSAMLSSLPDFNGTLWPPRRSIASESLKKSSHSLQRIEVMEMQIRRTNPGVIGKAKLNTIKITVALVGAFLACWTPYYFMCIWFWADPDTWEQISYSIRKFLFLFACTNSCANPLIYGAFTNKRSGIFASRERLYFLQTGKKNRKWKTSNAHMGGMEEEDCKASKEDRRSKSCSGSPNTYLRSKTITAFMRTELHYKERSFHGRDCNFDESLKKWRRAISSPNLHFQDSNTMVERDFNLIAEVHMRTNDIMLKVIPPD